MEEGEGRDGMACAAHSRRGLDITEEDGFVLGTVQAVLYIIRGGDDGKKTVPAEYTASKKDNPLTRQGASVQSQHKFGERGVPTSGIAALSLRPKADTTTSSRELELEAREARATAAEGRRSEPSQPPAQSTGETPAGGSDGLYSDEDEDSDES